MVTSNSLAKKIAKQKQAAPFELPKTRLCSEVVLSVLSGSSDFDLAIAKLKAGLGGNWSHVTAFQFMSGRQARLATECGLPEEQTQMLRAHQLAEALCNHVSSGNLNFFELRALAVTHTLQLNQA